MKIFVDKMPKEPKDCPYSRDKWRADEKYWCGFSNSHLCGVGISHIGCPHFIEFDIKNYVAKMESEKHNDL